MRIIRPSITLLNLQVIYDPVNHQHYQIMSQYYDYTLGKNMVVLAYLTYDYTTTATITISRDSMNYTMILLDVALG